MTSIERFLESHGLAGEVVPADDNPLDLAQPGAKHYRATLRAHGPDESAWFETYCSRSADAPVPSIGEALAEAARRASGAQGGSPRGEEARRLRDFLGDGAYQELLSAIGDGRSDDAARRGVPRWAAMFAAGPAATLALGAWLYGRGRQRTGGVALAVGAAGAVIGAVGGSIVSRQSREQRQPEHKTLAAGPASTETGHA